MSEPTVLGIVTAGNQSFVIDGEQAGDAIQVSVRREGRLLFSLQADDLNDGFCAALDLIRDEIAVTPSARVWGVLELVAP